MVFICRENPRRSGILLFPDRPRFYRLMKTRNRRYPRSSGMNGDKSEESGAFQLPDASQISAMVGDHSRHMKTQICTVGDIGVRRRWISLITNPLKCWAPVSLSQVNVSFLENLGQTSGEYPIHRQNLGCSAKSKIPDCLGFSRYMKTRLYLVK